MRTFLFRLAIVLAMIFLVSVIGCTLKPAPRWRAERSNGTICIMELKEGFHQGDKIRFAGEDWTLLNQIK